MIKLHEFQTLQPHAVLCLFTLWYKFAKKGDFAMKKNMVSLMERVIYILEMVDFHCTRQV